MLERAFEAASHEPGVKRIMAVLDQNRSVREAEEGPPRVPELGRADQHRAVDVVAPSRIWVDGGAAVDERIEERQRAIERKPLGPDLENEERRVARRFDVQRHELRVLELRAGSNLRRIDRYLLPWHRPSGTAGLEQDRSLAHRASAKALRAKAISSAVTARNRSAAPA